MWYKWTTFLLVCCALVRSEETTAALPVVTTSRPPPRTLDRQAAELAWKSWLYPESGNQNAPARRITTKSLFITPLVCPKGQRLNENGCEQVVTINQDEHERNLLAQLNALFTQAPSGDLYDYGDDEPGPLQLSIPIGLDPLAAPLQGQDPSAQAQELQGNFIKVDKKHTPDSEASIVAELELLKLQNNSYTSHGVNGMTLNDLANINIHPDKPKRDSSAVNVTEAQVNNTSEDLGQKEVVFGHVNVDPIIFHINNNESSNGHNVSKEIEAGPLKQDTLDENSSYNRANATEISFNGTMFINETAQVLQKEGDQIKLNPENDYSDIGEAIKLISRYAEVTTDDNFAKDQRKNAPTDDNILGTRTKLQHRRNKPKESESIVALGAINKPDNRELLHNIHPKNGVYYRYPWAGQHIPTPPPDYPFRHLQDYWSGRNKFGGVYNTHENPRRHHHSFPHNLRANSNPFVGLPNVRAAYPEQLKSYIHRVAQRHLSPSRPHANNHDLYSLLGLKHWFSSEDTSKR